jgi:hypothetical protein
LDPGIIIKMTREGIERDYLERERLEREDVNLQGLLFGLA